MEIIRDIELEIKYNEVIDKLILSRQQQGIKQYELAKSAGVTQPTISDIEKKKKRASFMTVIRIAKALGEVVML